MQSNLSDAAGSLLKSKKQNFWHLQNIFRHRVVSYRKLGDHICICFLEHCENIPSGHFSNLLPVLSAKSLSQRDESYKPPNCCVTQSNDQTLAISSPGSVSYLSMLSFALFWVPRSFSSSCTTVAVHMDPPYFSLALPKDLQSGGGGRTTSHSYTNTSGLRRLSEQ